MDVAADGSRIFEHFKTPLLDDGRHAQIHEAAGVKQCRPVAGLLELLGESRTRISGVCIRRHIEGRILRAQNGQQPLDAFRIDGVRVLKRDGLGSECRQVRHRVHCRL